MNKRVPMSIVVALMLIVSAVSITITHVWSMDVFNRRYDNVPRVGAIHEKINEIDRFITESFLDDVDTAAILDNIARGYIQGLDDRWAQYLTEEEFRAQRQASEGRVVGICVTINRDAPYEYIFITRVMPGTPAEEAGVLPGDVIVQVAGQDVAEIGYVEAVSLLIGEEGTSARFIVRRDDVRLIQFNIDREEYEATSVWYQAIDGIGYIHLTGFNAGTASQFEDAMNSLIDVGVSGFIFDVRGNGGGALSSVENVLNLILPRGVVITAEYANNRVADVFRSDSNRLTELPMVVITNGSSASAAELFAAAVRDMADGILVGETTYGKGSMQQTFELNRGGAIRFTIARFKPPSGVSFDGIGITPDIEVALSDEQIATFHRLSLEDDPQVQAALAALTQ